MTSSVLFDVRGPRARARHRLYTVVSAVLLLLVVAAVLWRFQQTGQLAYAKWEPFVTPSFMVSLLQGLGNTLVMAFSSVIAAVVFGLLFGVGKMSDHAWVRWPSWVVVEFFRAVPVLLLMVFIFFTYGTGDGGIGSYWSVVIALTLYNGSVLAEVFRAGIDAVPHGQAEAAYALGMRKTQVMTSVLLPQAVKIMLPAIISQCVVALKDTSLGYYILAPGLTATAKAIFQQFSNQLQTAIVVGVMYIACNLVLTWIATLVQRRLVGDQKQAAAVTAVTGAGTGETGGFGGGV
jgi:glutamate transport system permease protein